MSATVQLSIDGAKTLLIDAFSANGVSHGAALSVSDALVEAEMEGQAGHGFSRVDDYIAQVRSGKINPSAEPKTRQTAPAVLQVDAEHGFAYPALDAAIEQGSALAAEMGVASVAVAHSHHCGALSVQVRRIAEHGLVGFMVANAPAAIAPWGASQPLYGTNPIAFAAPCSGRAPLVIDLSLSKVARGKVMHAHKTGQLIPEGWAVDRAGQPTTDPAKGLAGTMVPIGEAKGTSLALMVEILAALMTGSSLSKDVSSFFTPDGPPPDVGQFLLLLKPPHDVDFAARLEGLLSLLDGFEGARVPGDRREGLRAKAERDGIAVPRAYVDRVIELASSSDNLPAARQAAR
ncbi:MAG: Ldh family oxidoreductase [Pseudomonadota bacterium]